MSVIRVRKDANYFAASNEPFNDIRLSWETRGLMGYLLSKPDHWEVRLPDLEKQGPAGSRKLKRMLAEMRKYGYMNRIRTKLENGKFDWTSEIYESPSQNPNPTKSFMKTSGAFCTSAFSTGAKPHHIVSTESDDTKIFNALEKLIGSLNSGIPRFVDTWLEKHPLERILEAIDIARENGARSEKYVDKVLIGWEANGYPKTRDQQVKDAGKPKNGKIQVNVPEVKEIPMLDPGKVRAAKEAFHAGLSGNK